MVLEGGQAIMRYTASVRTELHDQFIAARNGQPPWSTNSFIRSVRNTEHHYVISSGIFANVFRNTGPWVLMKQASKTIDEAIESYMVEVIAESSF